MKKLILAAALMGFTATTAFAQGANPSAPQPGSTGMGVNQPGTTATGTAVDAPTKMKMSKKKSSKKMMKKM